MQILIDHLHIRENTKCLVFIQTKRLRLFHLFETFLDLVRHPYIILISEHIVVGFHLRKHPKKIILCRSLGLTLKDHKVIRMIFHPLFENMHRLICRTVVMDITDKIIFCLFFQRP